MAERLVATKIGSDELADTDSAPGIKREEAFAKPGLWAGRSTTEPGVTSGWHHHGEADTIVYVLSVWIIRARFRSTSRNTRRIAVSSAMLFVRPSPRNSLSSTR